MGVRSSARRWPRNRGESPIRVRRTRRACFAQPARATFSDALRRPQTQVMGRECLRYPTIDSVGPNLVMFIQITAPCYRGTLKLPPLKFDFLTFEELERLLDVVQDTRGSRALFL